MNPDIRPITVTTLLSLALHASLLFGIVQTIQPARLATGEGVSIELVSSSHVSNQRETEQAAASEPRQSEETRQDEHTATNTVVKETTQKQVLVEAAAENVSLPKMQATRSASIDYGSGEKVLTRSTDAAGHKLSIVALLHSRISERKEYPYMARRQRREGVSRVAFVLHPDGSIKDARLVQSSKTRILDRAALEAVRGIEPFEPAKDYLDRPEAFQVDVVFNMF